ncbi:response regulator [Kamptonema cortianum]|jgi:CheY-like chemotaxis protein|nr:response regulator [Kamptonema cortianum]
MRIVYVEDNLANVALIERICQQNGDELVTFSDAEAALNVINPGFADLILMDLNLGTRSIDGLQLTRLLRQKGVEEPIVAITAYDTLGYADQYQAAGCNEFLRKPVSVNAMLKLISNYR